MFCTLIIVKRWWRIEWSRDWQR